MTAVALEALGDRHPELVREKDLDAAFEAKELVVLARSGSNTVS